MLDTFFKKYPQSKTQYELNKLLIDMKSIPHALKEKDSKPNRAYIDIRIECNKI